MRRIPNNWLEVDINDVARVIGGGTPKSNDESNFSEPGTGVAWLTPADLSGYKERTISQGRRDLSLKGLETSSATLLPQGTLLFTSRAPIGYVAIAANEIATNQGFKSFIFSKQIDSDFAYYYLKYIRPLAESRGVGTTFKELSGAAAKKLPFLIAPFNEQRRIAAKLESLLAKVASSQARLESIPLLIESFRQSVLLSATSGDLTMDWREKSQVDWQLVPIGDLVEVKGGKRLPKGGQLIEADSGFPYIRAGQLKKGTVINNEDARSRQLYLTPEIQSKISRYIVSKGDVYLTIVGASIGDAGVVPSQYDGANLTENAAKLTEFKVPLESDFLALCLRSKKTQELIKKEIKSGAQGKLALKRIRSLLVPYTNIAEQKEVIRRVESLFVLSDIVEKKHGEAKKYINGLAQAILAKAFRGELVQQDPNDESAVELLKRIQVDRQANVTPVNSSVHVVRPSNITKEELINRKLYDIERQGGYEEKLIKKHPEGRPNTKDRMRLEHKQVIEKALKELGGASFSIEQFCSVSGFLGDYDVMRTLVMNLLKGIPGVSAPLIRVVSWDESSGEYRLKLKDI